MLRWTGVRASFSSTITGPAKWCTAHYSPCSVNSITRSAIQVEVHMLSSAKCLMAWRCIFTEHTCELLLPGYIRFDHNADATDAQLPKVIRPVMPRQNLTIVISWKSESACTATTRWSNRIFVQAPGFSHATNSFAISDWI